MIPKKIHFCWLSNDSYPPKIQKCIDSWNKILPDYEIVKWDLNKFPISKSVWVKEAFEAKKYAFAADYIRFYALYTEGGIYLDSDVEVIKSFNDLLHLPYFLCRENVSNNIEAAVMGSEANATWIKDCLDYYNEKHFINNQGTIEDKPLPLIMEEILSSRYGILDITNPSSFDQSLKSTQVYPYQFFSPKNYITQKIELSPNTYSIHHFTSSWRSPKEHFLIKIERFFGKKGRTFFWLVLRNPIHNIKGILRLLKERKIWWK